MKSPENIEEELVQLKSQLTEINVMLSKLLYTNRLFHTHDLSNPVKLAVIDLFDVMDTIEEVKWLWAVLDAGDIDPEDVNINGLLKWLRKTQMRYDKTEEKWIV